MLILFVMLKLFCLAFFLVCAEANEGDRILVTRNLYDEQYFFELLEPEDIRYLYKIKAAKDFGIVLNTSFAGVELVLAEPLHACSPLTNSGYIQYSVALVERGGCSFLSKAVQAEKAGAVAVIIMDYDPENTERMIDMIQDETARTTNIAAFFLLGKDGHMIKSTLERLDLKSAKINIPVNITGIPLTQPPWTVW